nr:AraC family transcriptional regulator [uncultured Clostridium sp.]
MIEQSERNLRLFRELIRCGYDLSFWTFDSHMQIVDTNCTMANEMIHFFSFEKDQINNLFQSASLPYPVVLTNQLSMVWIADFEQDAFGKNLYVHLIGPAFVENASLQSIKARLSRMTLSSSTILDFSVALESIPLVPMTRFLEYGLMMHYCITGENLSVSHFTYLTSPHDAFFKDDNTSEHTMHSSWSIEQKMLKLVEEGNLEYKHYANQIAGAGSLSNIGNGNSLRQVKNLVIIHTALCTRAAIRGGLDPDIAYSLSDRYINSVEDCKNIPDIAEVNATMQDDFVHRVYQCRNSSDVSPQVKKCCGYIQLHLGEQITLSQLAHYIGYSDSYLSKKFKEETGRTIKEYIMSSRIEHAKELLHSISLPIQDLCNQLGFGSQSYFGDQFRKATGMTPVEYRNRIGE